MCMCVLACIRARAPDTLSRIISVTSLEITCKYIIQGFARLLLLELCPATAHLLSLSVCNEAAMGPRGPFIDSRKYISNSRLHHCSQCRSTLRIRVLERDLRNVKVCRTTYDGWMSHAPSLELRRAVSTRDT